MYTTVYTQYIGTEQKFKAQSFPGSHTTYGTIRFNRADFFCLSLKLPFYQLSAIADL